MKVLVDNGTWREELDIAAGESFELSVPSSKQASISIFSAAGTYNVITRLNKQGKKTIQNTDGDLSGNNTFTTHNGVAMIGVEVLTGVVDSVEILQVTK